MLKLRNGWQNRHIYIQMSTSSGIEAGARNAIGAR